MDSKCGGVRKKWNLLQHICVIENLIADLYAVKLISPTASLHRKIWIWIYIQQLIVIIIIYHFYLNIAYSFSYKKYICDRRAFTFNLSWHKRPSGMLKVCYFNVIESFSSNLCLTDCPVFDRIPNRKCVLLSISLSFTEGLCFWQLQFSVSCFPRFRSYNSKSNREGKLNSSIWITNPLTFLPPCRALNLDFKTWI